LKAKSYDIPLDDAWSSARGQMREMSKDACRSAIHSNHVRNFSMNADFSDETWRFILLPVYIAAYRFGEKGYQVMVNGQSGKVAGQKPVAWRKVLAVILLALLPGLIAGLVGMLQGSSGGTALALGIFLFLAGIIADVIILRQAMQAGEA
jgi:hypothetical protein